MEFPKAFELFERFRPKFETVQLAPAGWWRENYRSTTRFALLIYRDGVEVPWHNRYSVCTIDVGKAALEFGFQFDPKSEHSVHDQLRDAVTEAVNLKLADRVFRLLPATPFTSLTGGHGREEFRDHKVLLDGDPVPGLDLIGGQQYQSGQQGKWDSFVPRGTPEGVAIQAALSYEYRQTLQARDVVREQEDARVLLESALEKL